MLEEIKSAAEIEVKKIVDNLEPKLVNKNIKYNTEKYFKIEKKDFEKHSLVRDLNEISQVPEQLYFYGDKKLLDAKNNGAKILCVIGSRKATTYGKEAVDYLLSGLAGENIIIVSGLALGIDSAAHKAAIKYNLTTIAFPGSGLENEVLYPQSNTKLLEEIIMSGGGAFSEYTPDSKSQIYYFPARNRLMAAISDLVLVIEAEEKSGTQITARLALEYGRDVAIVPGSIFSAYSRGTAKLFKDGAYPVTCSQDILELLNLEDTLDPIYSQDSLFQNNQNALDKNKTKNNQNKSDNLINSNLINKKIFNSKLFENLTEQENAILKLIKSPMQKEEIIESSGLLAHEALIALTTLEAAGILRDNFGEIIRVK